MDRAEFTLSRPVCLSLPVEEVDKLLAENAKLRSELAAAERRLDVREKLNLAKEDA